MASYILMKYMQMKGSSLACNKHNFRQQDHKKEKKLDFRKEETKVDSHKPSHGSNKGGIDVSTEHVGTGPNEVVKASPWWKLW